MRKIVGVLMGDRVVLESDPGHALMQEGWFGNPVGVFKAKASHRYDRPYELDLFEAVYLVEKGKLEVRTPDGRRLSLAELKSIARERIPYFDHKYVVYKDLREKGYVVRSGLKYGAEWLIYTYGPDVEHAAFIVHVLPPGWRLLGQDLVRAGRLAHSVRKKWAIACVRPDGSVRYFIFSWFKHTS